jgi:hypothetical protein
MEHYLDYSRAKSLPTLVTKDARMWLMKLYLNTANELQRSHHPPYPTILVRPKGKNADEFN